MKPWLKWTLIVIGVLVVFGIVADLLKSPEQKAAEARAAFVTDSTKKAVAKHLADSIADAGLGMPLSKASAGIPNLRKTDGGYAWNGTGVSVAFMGDTTNISGVAFHADFRNQTQEKIVVLQALMVTVLGLDDATIAMKRLGKDMQSKKSASTTDVGNKTVVYAMDRSTSETLIVVSRRASKM